MVHTTKLQVCSKPTKLKTHSLFSLEIGSNISQSSLAVVEDWTAGSKVSFTFSTQWFSVILIKRLNDNKSSETKEPQKKTARVKHDHRQGFIE